MRELVYVALEQGVGPSSVHRSYTVPLAFGLVIVAIVPYVALKVLWLTGSTVGFKDASAAAEMHSTRLVVGNNVTIGLELIAVALAIGLIHPRGVRVPAWVMVGIGASATGLLAPILIGLPLGSLLQLAVDGEVHTDGMDHLSGWVFALVYGGFCLLAISLFLLAWRYALIRWSSRLNRFPPLPTRWTLLAGVLGLLPFAAAMLWWGLSGPGNSGPQSMDAIAQRSVLVVAGLLALGGFLAPLVAQTWRWRPRVAWLITWTGCTTAALQSPAMLLLADQGRPTPAGAALALITIPGATAYGLLALRQPSSRRPAPAVGGGRRRRVDRGDC